MLHWLKKTGANCCCILVDLPVKHNSSLHFLVTALGRYSNNVSLVEKFKMRNLRSCSTPSNSLLRSMRTWHSRSGVRTILIFFSTLDLAIIHQYWEWPQLSEKGSFDHHHAMYGAQTG